MSPEDQIKEWISREPDRMAALRVAARLQLPDWCLAAGFVRNLVWDRLHGYKVATPLTDIDLIYFDSSRIDRAQDRDYERALMRMLNLPWSVKNQARMHRRNRDEAYRSTIDAMSYWLEIETAIGVRFGATGALELVAPFGADTALSQSITINPKRAKPQEFRHRISAKKWLSIWPDLVVRC